MVTERIVIVVRLIGRRSLPAVVSSFSSGHERISLARTLLREVGKELGDGSKREAGSSSLGLGCRVGRSANMTVVGVVDVVDIVDAVDLHQIMLLILQFLARCLLSSALEAEQDHSQNRTDQEQDTNCQSSLSSRAHST
jgi:hypothetical protein